MARKIIGGAITSMPHNDNYEELYNRVNQAEVDSLELLGDFNSHKSMANNRLDALEGVRVHVGNEPPSDTILWFDISED
jgi:hypothetical protein